MTFLGLTAEMLARLQFAFTVSFHFLFPAFSIGTASFLAVLNGLWLWKRDEAYLKLFEYWKTIFAITFGMGVVSGIVMSYQFGTNWARFSDKAGAVIGPLMGYEVLTAFFLEAGFLGIALFGRKRVGDTMHMVAVVAVAVGTLISATWITSANSWMHTPAGFSIDAAGSFVPEDWWAIVFNPSFPYRMTHTVLAAFLTTAFAVGGVGAWHLLHNEENRQSRIMFSMAMWMAAIVTPIQIFVGDQHGLNTLEHQPAKIAAMEGHFETHENGAPLILFGIPDDEAEVTRYALEIPKLGSLILTHHLNGRVQGLKDWPRQDRPPALMPFITFRVMVGIGFLMLALGIWSLYARAKGSLYSNRALLRSALIMGPSGFVAVLAGWYTTEVGRQPYTIYGLLRTSDSLSPVSAPAVGTSLLAFIAVYFIVFGTGTFYLLKLMRRVPELTEDPELDRGPTRAAGTTPGPAQDDPMGGENVH
ncbi:cytochrome ubiquinol oxidase subunit I [Phyllobacterium endophyticum]|uniref:Cytochrome ubiquinol oxidase subunit I n=1 Tax=Phyllobacterium endophyticum TaxID=1149773 RepID=A0A2P7ANW0_9HYPH|nr:cytochrome ubiquinol oxidase subunit I [Phyllobacterium endophyticum]MBB3233764.1 cytochrome d ubiquinol oxidase subunit I [Phyllobacterium endophyticum]PSH55895.1 cytochrome ubiquinol oxidase subunit I [Phyllobacterium endophyticum]TYR41036.1 cytochrome ubiquinol oxidase subunit I [Phyllobacterium endophyticum]